MTAWSYLSETLDVPEDRDAPDAGMLTTEALPAADGRENRR